VTELDSNRYRGVFVGGAILLWMSALMGGLQSSDIVTTSRPATANPVSIRRSNEEPSGTVQDRKFEDVTELVIQSPRRRVPKPPAEAIALVPTALVSPPTYPVWFESERDLGICKINWDGGTMTANLHASARLPEGKLVFSYACGNRRGRASIDVEPTRVNGVLFCEDAGGVKVDTVRRDDGRCEHS
jgi:hypothetical protein